MKIDVIGPTFPTKGGISHYNTLMCENLAKSHQVNCYSFKRMYIKWLYPGVCETDEQSKSQIRTSTNRIVDSVNPLSWIRTFNRIRKDKADLVIIPWWTSWLSHVFISIALMTKLFTKSKVLFLCHNVIPHKREPMDRPLAKITFSLGDYFITHSKQDRDDLVSIKKKANVKVGVHPTYEVFNQKPLDKEEVKKEMGIRNDAILFFGYVKPYKGLSYLVEAMPEILKGRDVTLLIVGEFWSPTKEEVLSRAKELGISDKIKIVDSYVPNEEVGKYYCASDVVVLPYVSATSSGIVQTAFGFNIPVIVTNTGGLPEVVIDGKTGYIVPTENSTELAKSVLRYYREKDSVDFSKNIEEDKKRFEWSRMVELIESFMK
ncbi:MAG: glycosyltransferase [Nanoarchaeota archaeon]